MMEKRGGLSASAHGPMVAQSMVDDNPESLAKLTA